MPEWFAIVCLTDQFDQTGKLDYRAGEVKSFGSVVTPGTDAEYAVAVDINGSHHHRLRNLG